MFSSLGISISSLLTSLTKVWPGGATWKALPLQFCTVGVRPHQSLSSSFLRSLMSLWTTCRTCSASVSVSPVRSSFWPVISDQSSLRPTKTAAFSCEWTNVRQRHKAAVYAQFVYSFKQHAAERASEQKLNFSSFKHLYYSDRFISNTSNIWGNYDSKNSVLSNLFSLWKIFKFDLCLN